MASSRSIRSSALLRKKGSANPIASASREKTSQLDLHIPTAGMTASARWMQ